MILGKVKKLKHNGGNLCTCIFVRLSVRMFHWILIKFGVEADGRMHIGLKVFLRYGTSLERQIV
jgi:hypothetical protein